MEGKNKKDLEWRFDLDYTQVNNFKRLVGLIVILHAIPNLNQKLDDEGKKFVEACYHGFGCGEKNCDWYEIIKEHKENRNLSLTGNIYNRVSSEFEKIPFEKLSEIMKGNNFTWDKIFDMIKKLDCYCYIYFTDDFFDFKDLAPDLQEKLKQEKAFGEFKENWKKNREATMTNNRKNWIKKVNLEGKKIIKSREDLKEIFTKIRECLDDGLFLYSNEEKIIRYELVYDHHGVFHFLWEYRDDENYSDMGNRKLVLELLADLGFSFDYEKFIGNENTFGEEIKAESTSSNYSEEYVLKQFKKLVRNFNRWRDFDKSILWFDDKNKKIDVSMLGFNLWFDVIKPMDEKYNRGFSERDMSCVLDKFKNEKKGFCHDQNMQFFVYMMNHPCKDEFRIMKDEKKREQFYLDLMDVIAKSVSVDSISINKIFNCKERDFTKQEEEDFIKKNNLQGIEEKTINTLTFAGYTEKGDKCYWKNEKNQKLLLNKIEYAGYFWDIITRIPKDVLNKKGIKKKIKETLQKILEHTYLATVEQKNVISLMLFVYKHFDLDLSNEDISELWQKVKIICSLYNNSESFWLNDMFRIIFKNRNKFPLDEKKKLLDEVMNTKINLFGWSFSGKEKELEDNKSKLNQKIKRIQRVFRGYKQREKLPKKINRDALKLYMKKLLDKRKLKNTIKIQKVFRGFSYRKKLNDKAIKLQTAVRKFLAKRKLVKLKLQKEKLTSICKCLFGGFVFLLVIFLFEMFVLDVAFLSVPAILTLLVTIVLGAIFLYIEHKFKIFFWKHKLPRKTITESPIQKENLISVSQNNLITNQGINTFSFNPNAINNLIDTSTKNQNSNSKPFSEGNIINTSENNQKQINLNGQNI